MGNCQADNQGRLLEYERFPFGSDLLGAIQRGKDIRYIIFSRQAPWDDKIKYGIFRRSRVGDSGIAARLPRSNTSNGNSGSGSGCSSGSRWPCRSGSPCWPARSSGSRRPGRSCWPARSSRAGWPGSPRWPARSSRAGWPGSPCWPSRAVYLCTTLDFPLC